MGTGGEGVLAITVPKAKKALGVLESKWNP